ncbi:MAG: LLM class flavin-dependent oxidoreductase [Nitrososphaerota archaeon]
MEFDITFGPVTGDPKRIAELARLAERLGYKSAWITHDPLWDNSWVVCGAVGLATSRILVGPAIVNPYSSSLVEIAMGAVTLNNLTGGRAVLGFGPGSKKMLEESGLSHINLLATMDHSIRYLREALTPSTSKMKQKNSTSIPIFFGCQSPKLLERVGLWRVGALVLLTPPSYGVEALKLIQRGAEKSGLHDIQSEVVASILCSINRDEDEARSGFASFIMHILEYLSPHQLDTHSLTPHEIAEVRRTYSEGGWETLPEKIFRLGAVGVEGCIKTVEMLHAMGYRRVKVGSPLGHDKEEAVRLFAEEVMPHFQDC